MKRIASLLSLPLIFCGLSTRISLAGNTIDPQAKADGTATVIVTVDDNASNDGSGYQLLLDPDCRLYEQLEIVFNSIILPDDKEAFYQEADFKIPAQAAPDCVSPVLFNGDADTLEIPAGHYDLIFLNPYEYEDACQIYAISAENNVFSSASFAAGLEYRFFLTRDDFGYLTVDVASPVDMQVTEMASPVSKAGLGSHETVSVRIRNTGTETVQAGKARLFLEVDESLVAEESLEEDIESQEELVFQFAQTADLSETGLHRIRIWSVCEGDILTANDTLDTEINNIPVLQSPFSEDFSSDSLWRTRWTIIDHNEDLFTWDWERDSLLCRNHKTGAAMLSFTMQASDDYLVTHPIAVPAGDNHFLIRYRAESRNYPERMAVLFGFDPDPAKMQVLDTLDQIVNENYYTYSYSFNLAQDSICHFGVHGISDADQLALLVDDFYVGPGIYQGTPDLILEEVILPPSGCELSEAAVQLQVSNMGDDRVKEIKAYYTLQGASDSVFQTFPVELGVGVRTILAFDSTFSVAEGNSCTILAGLLPAEREDSLRNNTGEASVRNLGSIESFPAMLDPHKQEIRSLHEGGWSLNNDTLQAESATIPLVSACLELEANSRYRINYEYMGGIMELWAIPDGYRIRYGKSLYTMEQWETAIVDSMVYETFFVPGECEIKTDETGGTYIFCIEAIDIPANLRFCNFKVSQVMPSDMRLADFSSGIANRYPADLVPGEHNMAASLRNRGTEAAQNAKTDIWCNGSYLASSPMVNIASDSTALLRFPVALKDLSVKTGDTLHLQASALIEQQEDAYPEDNTITQDIILTDTVMAWDNASAEHCISRYQIEPGYPICCAMPYSLPRKDTLSSLTTAWSRGFEREIVISILKWNPMQMTIEDTVYSFRTIRTPEPGFKTFDLPGIQLEAGDYLFAIDQPAAETFGLIGDGRRNGFTYVIEEGKIRRTSAYGYAVIRANFGEGSEAYSLDAAALSIISPADMQAYTNQQAIVVEVANLGSEGIKAVPVHCVVNGKELPVQEILLMPYSTEQLTFTADMSQADTKYEIAAYTALASDQNPANDTVRATLTSLPALDPYRMDFEYCPDFAISGFSPAWTSLDQDQSPTIGFQDVSYPGKEAAMGFMAFNPYETTPPMLGTEADVQYEQVRPIQGYKFGAAFCATSTMNDDWLVSPKLQMPAKGSQISFYTKGYSAVEDPEQFAILVSTGSNQVEDFEDIGLNLYTESEWTLHEIDLSKYDGREIHIAIRCITLDGFVFMIDDIQVKKPGTGIEDQIPAQAFCYPNPAHSILNIVSPVAEMEQIEVFDMQGKAFFRSHTNLKAFDFRLDVENYPEGLYLVRIQTTTGVQTLKVLIR